MNPSVTISVPSGMSCVNAFHALWENSTPIFFLQRFPTLEANLSENLSTAEKVANLFKKSTFFGTPGGRFLNIDFSRFPLLDVTLYDRNYGPGMAQKTLELYSKISSQKRFDKNDSCQFQELIK